MYYVLFRSTALPNRAMTSQSYYEIASKMDGFVDVNQLTDTADPNVQFIFARFKDEEAISAWRNNQTRLSMMHNARHDILFEFRLTVGVDDEHSSAAPDNAVMIVVHQKKLDGRLREEIMDHFGSTDEVERSELYIGDEDSMRVDFLKQGADAEKFVGGIRRVEGDVVCVVRMIREYSKGNRQEAPKGLEEAEKVAVAQRVTA